MFIIAQSCIIDKVHLISWLHKVLWNCFCQDEATFRMKLASKLLFMSLFFQSSNTFSQELLFQNVLFFTTANFQLLTSFSQ